MSDILPYDILNKGWKATCKILLGEEIGELSDYREWLSEFLPPTGKTHSHLSGKEVTLAMDAYCPKSRFISSDEIKEKKLAPLSIDQVKDIDSIAEAISERWEYTGNRVLGNSSSVDSSDLVMDSQFVSGSTNIQQSSYVYSSALARMGSKYIYGSHGFAQGEFLIRHCAGFNLKRQFETHFITDSSDLYFAFNCIGCSELLFSFFQRNKRHCIGNLQLPKEKYLSLKKKLLSEVASELKRNKRFPSLFHLVPNSKPRHSLSIPQSRPKEDMPAIDKAFSSAFKVIFRKDAQSVFPYEKWLSRQLLGISEIKSPFGHKTCFPETKAMFLFFTAPRSRMVSLAEGMELGKRHLEEPQLSSLSSIIDNLGEIGYFTAEFLDGPVTNAISTPIAYYSSNVYKALDATHSEYSGLSSQVLNSKYCFGGFRILESQFCLNCYNSLNLSRCLEVDTSEKCSDSLFCHNSEGLAECMFCFNLKGKRYAIGNSPLPPQEYLKVKDSLLSQMADELERNHLLPYDIFNIGCAGA
ncbi:MAG: hypothetical protein AB1657_05960 [Candidatus Micrarchaeota archaeon]